MTHPGDLLSAYLDQQLADSERSAVDAHLAECPACHIELTAVRESRQLVRSLPLLEPPSGVFDLTAEVIPLRRGRVRRMVAAAAVSALIVGVGFSLSADRAVPLPLDAVVEQHVARASVDRGFNVLQVQAVVNR
jgi:anti-sigma factor RsiW